MTRETDARLDAIDSRTAAIDALVADDAEAFDAPDLDLLATLWHPDSWLLPGATGNATGLEAILGRFRANVKRMPHRHHGMASAVVTVAGDRGHGRPS